MQMRVVCHPSHAPGGCAHGVGVDLTRKVRNQYPNNVFRDNTGPLRTSPNPSYTHTAIQYLGPRGTPASHPPLHTACDVIDMTSAPFQPQGTEERVYHVLEGPQEVERGENEEGEYHLLGEVEGGEGRGGADLPGHHPHYPSPSSTSNEDPGQGILHTPAQVTACNLHIIRATKAYPLIIMHV